MKPKEAEQRLRIELERHRMELRERQAELVMSLVTRLVAIALLVATLLLERG